QERRTPRSRVGRAREPGREKARVASKRSLERRTVGDAPKYAETSVGRSARVGRGPAEINWAGGTRVSPLRKRGQDAARSNRIGVLERRPVRNAPKNSTDGDAQGVSVRDGGSKTPRPCSKRTNETRFGARKSARKAASRGVPAWAPRAPNSLRLRVATHAENVHPTDRFGNGFRCGCDGTREKLQPEWWLRLGTPSRRAFSDVPPPENRRKLRWPNRPSGKGRLVMTVAALSIPEPLADDPDAVATALETAAIFGTQGDMREALRWVRRAAELAGDAGADHRALTLARL